jgi:glycosyltransferase involved in cell wall biosynthesis
MEAIVGPHGRPVEPGRVGGGNAAPRVALVHDWLTGQRGGEKCLEVIGGLFPEAPIHTLLHRQGAVSAAIEGHPIRTSPLQRIPRIHERYRALLPLMPLAARTWRVGPVDLVLSLSHCVAKAVRVPAGVPHVCYCFTPMRYAWTERAAYFESWRGRPARRAVAGFLLDRLQAWDRRTAAGVTHFVAISETIRRRIAACYDRESVVIPPPVDVDFYTPGEHAGDRAGGAYLVVSALVAYKKIEQALEACRELERPLVVIGEGPERARLERLAGPRARFLGWQPDAVIREQYRTCRALLFPGEEDFGIVPVEALACGAPVIALGRGGASETVDPRCGALYEEPTAAGLARAMRAWEAAGQPHDAGWGRHVAEGFGTARFAARVGGYVAEVLAQAAHRGRVSAPAPHFPAGRVEERGGVRRNAR